MRVYEYAKANGKTSAEVIAAVEMLKLDASTAASGLSDAEAIVLDSYFKKLDALAAQPAQEEPTAKKAAKKKAKKAPKKPPAPAKDPELAKKIQDEQIRIVIAHQSSPATLLLP